MTDEEKIAALEKQVAELTATQKELMGHIRRNDLVRPEITFITNWVRNHGVLVTRQICKDFDGHVLFPYRQKVYDWADRVPGLNEYRPERGPDKKIWYFEDEQLEIYLDKLNKRFGKGRHSESERPGVIAPLLPKAPPKTPEELRLNEDVRALIQYVRQNGDTDLREYGVDVLKLSLDDHYLIELRDSAHYRIAFSEKVSEHVSNEAPDWVFKRLKK